MIVIGVPLAILFGLALLAGVVVFAGLALANAVIRVLGGGRAAGRPGEVEGRENVRVIRRDGD